MAETLTSPEEQIVHRIKEVARIGDLLLAPCTAVVRRRECADQNKPLNDMCPNCKKYWEEACAFVGEDPNDVLARYYKEKK